MARYHNEHYDDPFPKNFRELLKNDAENRKGKRQREEKGIQKSIADICGVSQQMISKYSTGESKPDYLNLVKIAKYYGKSIDWLLGVPNAPEKINAEKQSVMEYTGLSEKALDAIMDYQKYSKKAFELLITREYFQYLMYDMESVIDLMKKPNYITQGFHVVSGDNEQEPITDWKNEKYGMTIFGLLRNSIQYGINDVCQEIKELYYNSIELPFVDSKHTYKDKNAFEKWIEDENDPWAKSILEALKGELYGNDNTTKE